MTKTGRNEPCPCGSGRKYKLCHGAVAVLAAAPAHAAIAPAALPATLPAAGTAAARDCGPCTACCEGWAEGEIRGHRMHPGKPCHFLRAPGERPAGTSPCGIYEERPQSPCRNFVCGWLAPGSPFPDEFRPDRVGVIIVPMRWHDRAAYVLLSAGRDPGPEMLGWMQAHAHASGAPFFYAENGERTGYGPPEFQHEMLHKLQRGERLW